MNGKSVSPGIAGPEVQMTVRGRHSGKELANCSKKTRDKKGGTEFNNNGNMPKEPITKVSGQRNLTYTSSSCSSLRDLGRARMFRR